ncbi:hypothetical protein [Massilia oculi]|uniref:hypothetical protein n=1 Tax=Massilia oculi TaxID=945844 RepID=UPI0028AA57EB|nr:hypothetical protein [Massilia oculi]
MTIQNRSWPAAGRRWPAEGRRQADESSSVVTALDGYQMARNGQAGKALDRRAAAVAAQEARRGVSGGLISYQTSSVT